MGRDRIRYPRAVGCIADNGLCRCPELGAHQIPGELVWLGRADPSEYFGLDRCAKGDTDRKASDAGIGQKDECFFFS